MPIEQNLWKKRLLNRKEEITTETATDDNSPIVVDVRTREEFSYGAVPNAICLPLDEFTISYEKVFGKNLDRDITVYCASGARSAYRNAIPSSTWLYQCEKWWRIDAR